MESLTRPVFDRAVRWVHVAEMLAQVWNGVDGG